MRFLLSLGILLLAGFAHAEDFRLEAGQEMRMEVPLESELSLSQQKIVEIERVGPKDLRVLGLKAGVVVLRAQTADKEQRWLIEVMSRDPQGDWLERSAWQAYFCQKPGIRCESRSARIAGESEDLLWMQEAGEQCRRKSPCLWQVRLSASGQKLWQSRLGELVPKAQLEILPEGKLLLRGDCQERKELETALAQLKSVYGLDGLIQCQASEPSSWVLELLLVAEKDAKGELSNPIVWDELVIPRDKGLRASLSQLSREAWSRIVAQPEILLSLGGRAELRDGQEIQTQYVQNESTEILWKSSGLKLEAKLLRIEGQKAQLQVRLGLSQPQAGLRTLDSSEFASEIWVPIGELKQVGRMTSWVRSEEEAWLPWLSEIPLVGPLFRWSSAGKGQSQLAIHVRLRPEESQPPE